jgi:hypothetical protein
MLASVSLTEVALGWFRFCWDQTMEAKDILFSVTWNILEIMRSRLLTLVDSIFFFVKVGVACCEVDWLTTGRRKALPSIFGISQLPGALQTWRDR